MVAEGVLAGIGVGVGVLYGTLGAGGSAFATPILALVGVPPILAIASPLPATIPAALAGAWSYRRSDDVAARVARRAIVAGFPAAILGALCSSAVPGTALLVLSATVLALAGARMVTSADAATALVRDDRVTTLAAAGVGFAAGLLANSGGFLLVPVFVLLAGLGMRQAAATSLLVSAVLSVPTLATHWALGHVDWTVAALFAVGLVPGTVLGSRVSRHLPAKHTQRIFGVLLVGFAAWFLACL